MERKPLWLWIDPTRECGLKCTFCYTKRSHAAEHLSVEKFAKYLDVILNAEVVVQQLTLNWRGDPLMAPELFGLLKEINKRDVGFPVEFHTNGTTITPAVAQELVSVAGRVSIFVSIDGGNQASHDFNRGEGTYRLAVLGLRRLLEARGERPHPRIGLYQLDLGVAEDDYDEELVTLGRAADDWIRIHPIHPNSGRRIAARAPGQPSKRAAGVGQLTLADRWWAREVASDHNQPQQPCFWAGNALFIAPNGDASVCLLSHTDAGILGNLLTTPFDRILANAVAFRAKISTYGRAAVPHCSTCQIAEGKPHQQIL